MVEAFARKVARGRGTGARGGGLRSGRRWACNIVEHFSRNVARAQGTGPPADGPRSARPRSCNIVEHFSRNVARARGTRSEEHTSELQSLMRSSYAVFCLKTKNQQN